MKKFGKGKKNIYIRGSSEQIFNEIKMKKYLFRKLIPQWKKSKLKRSLSHFEEEHPPSLLLIKDKTKFINQDMKKGEGKTLSTQ